MKKKDMNVNRRLDIFCPFCMKKFKANNVVFRRERGLQTVDKYIQEYYAEFRDSSWNTQTYQTVDPAYLPFELLYFDQNRVLRNVSIPDSKDALHQRLCPYCHNPLNRHAGTTPLHIVSVCGLKGSGKTTYEAALIDCLQQDKIGVLNFSMDSDGSPITTIDDNINKLKYPKTAAWSDTFSMEGPFNYLLTFPQTVGHDCVLSMIDLPGEYFSKKASNNHKNMLGTCGKAIRYSDTCIFLVDIENMQNTKDMLSNIVEFYGEELLRGDINVAAILYKADKMEKMFPEKPRFLNFSDRRDYTDCPPINLRALYENSRDIEAHIVRKNALLSSLNESLRRLVHKDHLLWFAAFSMYEGQYRPNNIEEPLLWSMALKGDYPRIGG